MRIVILGANGQLGRALTLQFPEATALDRNDLDLTSRTAMEDFNWSDYDVVINAAAYTNVDGAETFEGSRLATKVNASAPQLLAKIARQENLTLVHVSSDYVFDGTKRPHYEDEPFSPINVYGRTKADGDRSVMRLPQHFIVRTSWVVGDGGNFVRAMLTKARLNESPPVVSDQFGRLTFVSTLARGIAHLLESDAPYGTYNLSNDGPVVTWADVTREIFFILGRDDLTAYDQSTVEYLKDKPLAARRPLLSELSLEKIKAAGFEPHDWRDVLRKYVIEQG